MVVQQISLASTQAATDELEKQDNLVHVKIGQPIAFQVDDRFTESQVIARAFLNLIKPNLTPSELHQVEEFSLAILMPELLLRSRALMTQTDGNLSVSALAKEFDVPDALMATRLRNLGLA